MNLTVEVWRQPSPKRPGAWHRYHLTELEPTMSVLELLDRLNEELVARGEPAVAFESDCREGICGACGLVVNGFAHGPQPHTPACHQRLQSFSDGEVVRLEPFSAGAFPVLSDLVVDRSALDRVLAAGAFVSVDAGTAPEADTVPVSHDRVETALDYAACLGCGACVAACPNGSAHLFLGAKLTHLSLLPIPSQERDRRARAMVQTADGLFGPCSNFGECARACPVQIPLAAVAAVNHESLRAWTRRRLPRAQA